MSRFRIPLVLLASVLCCASLAGAAGFTEFEDRPTKDGDNSEDDPLTQAAPVPWNLQSFATAFPGRAKLIRGSLDANDVDAYAFSLTSGQLLLAALFETSNGEKNDTQIGLFTGTTAPPAASDDDSGPGFFSRLALSVTSTSTQRVAVSGFGDTSWNGTHQEAKGGLVPYTLVVAAVSNPPPFSESESNNTLATANPLPSEGVVGGSLVPNDVDYFKIDLEVGDRLAVSVFDLKTGQFQVAGGERNDALLGAFSPSGTLSATNDDGGPGFQSNLLVTVPSGQGGTWKIALTGFGDTGFTGSHKESFSYLLVVGRERACPNVVPLISGITTSTSKAYVTANLRGGDFYYIDRTTPGQHVLVDVPAAYECSQWIKTANDDKSVSANPHLQFTLSAPASVFIGFDTRSASEPPWLATGFTPTGEILDVADPDRSQEFRLERRDFAAGAVALGGNLPSSATSNYVVFAKPLDLTDTTHAFALSGSPAAVSVTIAGVTLVVNRQTGQSNAQFAGSIAAAINGNAALQSLRVFGLASGGSVVTTGSLQSVTQQASPIPALPFAWAVILCAAIAAALGLNLRDSRRDRGPAARSR